MGEWGKIKLTKMRYVWKPRMEAYYFIVQGSLETSKPSYCQLSTTDGPTAEDNIYKKMERKSLNMEKSVIYPEPSPQLTSVHGTGRHSTHTTRGER